MTTTEMTATGGEMVLLAMLPEESRVMLVQTSRLQTVGDLEDFIVDEYARVFPHLPPLSRGLRLQKCVSPELVLDRRAHTAVHQEASHRFVDLAKNVQAGNVFHNMEQIYIVTHAKLKPKKALVAQPTAIVAREEEEKSEAQGAQKPQAPEKIVEAVEGGQAAIGTQSNDSAKEKVPGRNEKIVEKERHAPSKTSAGIESRVKEKNVSGSVTKAATKETADAKKHVADESTGGRKKVVAKQSSEKADLKYKSTKAGTEQKSESKKTGKKETNDVKETKKKSRRRSLLRRTKKAL
ncbi:unnamed protein product [Hyaloperonospora brassicae]|uniref:Uncharacterized protein n=1 Tax=Hyaloperonospora brassicae TaxID=162125 RepID=A0AAV0UZX9_HYABA|nr:unnamed protein product [Hyaloperonospora brassicae]